MRSHADELEITFLAYALNLDRVKAVRDFGGRAREIESPGRVLWTEREKNVADLLR
jgi:hypothetical protein